MRLGRGWVVVVALAAGCAELKTGIRPDEQVNADYAYIYGRFFMSAPPAALGMAKHQSVGLLIRCLEGQEQTVWFSEKRDVQVFKLIPGRCAVDEVLFTDADGRVWGRIHPRRPASNSQDFAPGVAHYLGDYYASAKAEAERKLLHTEHRMFWKVLPAHQQYQLTTAELKRAFPALASLPTENRELIPESAPERAQSSLMDDAVRPPQ
jgi:hypothetical protein